MNFYLNKLKIFFFKFISFILNYTEIKKDWIFIKNTLSLNFHLMIFIILIPFVFIGYTIFLFITFFYTLFFIFIFLKNLFLVRFYNNDKLVIAFSDYFDKKSFGDKYFVNFFEKYDNIKTYFYCFEEVFLKLPTKKAFSIVYFTLKNINKFINEKKNENKNIKQILFLVFIKINTYIINKIFFIITTVPFKIILITSKIFYFYKELFEMNWTNLNDLITTIFLNFFFNIYSENQQLVLVHDCKIIIERSFILFNPKTQKFFKDSIILKDAYKTSIKPPILVNVETITLKNKVSQHTMFLKNWASDKNFVFAGVTSSTNPCFKDYSIWEGYFKGTIDPNKNEYQASIVFKNRPKILKVNEKAFYNFTYDINTKMSWDASMIVSFYKKFLIVNENQKIDISDSSVINFLKKNSDYLSDDSQKLLISFEKFYLEYGDILNELKPNELYEIFNQNYEYYKDSEKNLFKKFEDDYDDELF